MDAIGHPHDTAFHAGELAVQQRAGVEREAARLAPMLDPQTCPGRSAGSSRRGPS